VVKNFQDGQWIAYDDSKSFPITEASLEKEYAYILFYMRKDLDKKELAEVYPHIQQALFPGKPVSLPLGDAFVTRCHGQDEVEVMLRKEKELKRVKRGQLLEEKDSIEFVFDDKDIQEIEHCKHEKIKQVQKQQQQAARNSSFFSLVQHKAFQCYGTCFCKK